MGKGLYEKVQGEGGDVVLFLIKSTISIPFARHLPDQATTIMGGGGGFDSFHA